MMSFPALSIFRVCPWRMLLWEGLYLSIFVSSFALEPFSISLERQSDNALTLCWNAVGGNTYLLLESEDLLSWNEVTHLVFHDEGNLATHPLTLIKKPMFYQVVCLDEAISIHHQPTNWIAQCGESVAFDVGIAVSDYLFPEFQWYFNGEAIDGAFSSTLNLSDTCFDEAGYYQLKIHSGNVLLESQPVSLSIRDPEFFEDIPSGEIFNSPFLKAYYGCDYELNHDYVTGNSTVPVNIELSEDAIRGLAYCCSTADESISCELHVGPASHYKTDGIQPLSFSFWCFYENTTASNPVFEIMGSEDGGTRFAYYQNLNAFVFTLETPEGPYSRYCKGGRLEQGQWTHFALVYDPVREGEKWSVYLNGTLLRVDGGPMPLKGNIPFEGKRRRYFDHSGKLFLQSFYSSSFQTGKNDEFAVWVGKALTLEEVNWIYETQRP